MVSKRMASWRRIANLPAYSRLSALACTTALLTATLVSHPALAAGYDITAGIVDASMAGSLNTSPLYPERHSKKVAREEAIAKRDAEVAAERAAAEKAEKKRQMELAEAEEEAKHPEKEIVSPFPVGASGYAEKPAPAEPEKIVIASADINGTAPQPIGQIPAAAPSIPDSVKLPATPSPAIGQVPAGVVPAASATPAAPASLAAPAPVATAFVSPTSSNPAIAPIPAMVAESLSIIPIPPAPPTMAKKDVVEPGVFVEPEPTPQPATPHVAGVPSSIAVPDSPMVAGTPTVFGQAPGMNSLGSDTRSILARLPNNLGAPPAQAKGNINIKRISPDIAAVVGVDKQDENYSAAGISINVRGGNYDANHDLSRAYNALVADDAGTAVRIYTDILSADPKNQDALFGLAATYHRAGAVEQARPLYVRLLTLNPEHREGLNNFLALVSDQAPEDALVELEKLAARNPSFSPIHAQVALLYQRLGAFDRAREKMLYAIELAPENLVYQYNLAVMLDQEGQRDDAIALYQKLIRANGNGATLPAPVEQIQKRLNFLTAQSVAGSAG